MKKRVVITGMSGCIGQILYENLKDSWDLSGIDIRHNQRYPIRIVDISNEGSISNAFEDAYAVVHLAANASARATWEEVSDPNISGTINVFEAARQAGVTKILFASSNHVTGLYEQDEPYKSIIAGRYEGLNPSDIPQIDHTMPIRPDGYYGISKAFGETLGRYYSEMYGIQVICLRIGTVNRENKPFDIRQFATLLMYRDLVNLVERSLQVSDIKFDILYGVSGNKWRFWDINHIKDCLGWMPEENSEIYR